MVAQDLVRFADGDRLADAVADRLATRLAELQSQSPTRVVQLALTGGRIAASIYQRLGARPVDWSRVELWWGDERWVPHADPDRNAKQALDALGEVEGLAPARVHQMPASDSGLDLDRAAAAYAAELADTVFDLCLLGLGPDGHVASIFPDHPSLEAARTGTVMPVRSSPKPPPERISLTLDPINRSREVWFCVSGDDKAEALRRVRDGDLALPGSAVSAAGDTLWWVDRAAASQLPE
ncbi:6-phosphogluconolactonase [Microlunatus panaciterrae]|uniref:6-phosphogluconolactonase n=1 Tax=Microlunatus panaciterrae TaxID=400768 RepID=A0ABS2RMK7_9ACTN|nr:6-phosphogluconolactonase [Microlunatus panaciterrae]MBM7800248.1 6-phosphogluconolactonase [Microlunatus panaciterrae]